MGASKDERQEVWSRRKFVGVGVASLAGGLGSAIAAPPAIGWLRRLPVAVEGLDRLDRWWNVVEALPEEGSATRLGGFRMESGADFPKKLEGRVFGLDLVTGMIMIEGTFKLQPNDRPLLTDQRGYPFRAGVKIGWNPEMKKLELPSELRQKPVEGISFTPAVYTNFRNEYWADLWTGDLQKIRSSFGITAAPLAHVEIEGQSVGMVIESGYFAVEASKDILEIPGEADVEMKTVSVIEQSRTGNTNRIARLLMAVNDIGQPVVRVGYEARLSHDIRLARMAVELSGRVGFGLEVNDFLNEGYKVYRISTAKREFEIDTRRGDKIGTPWVFFDPNRFFADMTYVTANPAVIPDGLEDRLLRHFGEIRFV